MTTIALIGPGAIGGTIAAWLAQVPGNDLTLCARTPFHRLVVEVDPEKRTLDLTPRVLVDPESANVVDWVIAVTKTYDTEGAGKWLRRLVGPETGVAVVQNGVEHARRFADLVEPARLLPTIIELSAERSAPGVIRQRRHGDITVPRGELGERFAALFAGTPLVPKLSGDILTVAWRKLTTNSAGIVNALTLKPAGIVHHPKAAALMRGIARETIAVGRTVGAKLDDALADEVVERSRRAARDSVNSILADRLAGHRTEVDARNGVVVRLGEQHGIATPLNAMAVAIVEAASEKLEAEADLRASVSG